MSVESKEDLEQLTKVGSLVADTIRLMRKSIRPGMTTRQLDQIARNYFESFGARSAPEITYDFPGATCISINDEVAHGIPSDRIIGEDDMVNIDVSLEWNGYYADSGYTILMNHDQNDRRRKLCETSYRILNQVIKRIRGGSRINQIGYLIDSLAKRAGFSVIKNLAGHGTGGNLHEEPYDILNFCDHSDNRKLRTGTVIAIETFISQKASFVITGKDGWTLKCPDRSLVAQYEHSIVVTDSEPIILTA